MRYQDLGPRSGFSRNRRSCDIFPTVEIKLGDNLQDTEYSTSPQLLAAYEERAMKDGYGIVLEYEDGKGTKKGRKVIYMCGKGGKPRNRKNINLHDTKRRPNAGSHQGLRAAK